MIARLEDPSQRERIKSDMGDPNAKSGSPHPLEPALPADARVAGRYRIVRFLARGGMGEVYEAEDTELHERVALKALPSRLAGDAEAVARLRREVQLARQAQPKATTRLVFMNRERWWRSRHVIGANRQELNRAVRRRLVG